MSATTNSDWTPERRARAALTFICEPGKPDLSRLVAEQGAPAVVEALRNASSGAAWTRRARCLDLDALIARAEGMDARLIIPGDDEWPPDLAGLERIEPVGGMCGAPLALWVRGRSRLDEILPAGRRALAVVGARACTRYGQLAATDLASQLAGQFPIVSGGAYGIDIAAHRGALGVGAPTIAIMAGGLDEWYPRGNTRVFEQIVDEWAVISELPPGMRPTRPGFLARNRLIAALAMGVVVVEAAARSGAVNTARWAGSLGRIVMAVPGPVTSGMSETPHRLIRDHEAELVAGADDVRALLCEPGEQPEMLSATPSRLLDGLDPQLLAVREALPGRGSLTVDELAARARCTSATCAGALIELELLGLVGQSAPGRWRLSRPRR
ncbi:DNA-processing protein DprA [Propionibacterium australiense]|uniref:DNA-protecting protein DprA n=1 Tax=Propionibacterium australiense TaxID=119981 RepID=A0A383S906_9ACTN|nr:DNA-processing protein DprA [Propionibacterium australiense]RLP06482.1 DNA-protecting protein DprA [Propionibacterium australiense]RLP06550.1 DNA-protecting protein DprA [Propionibacterium australiense]SYZ34397.1 dprA: DNA protecting protein DprA [Propionibacterium australiense]VEH92082.1 Transposase and inactivated derivatives [Propionibacterium australiense]